MNNNITDEGISHLINLNSLVLSNNGIKELTNLTFLDSGYHNVITSIKHLTNLKILKLQNCNQITNLTNLDLWENNNLTDEGISNLVNLS
jgi:hypothetical protein